MPTTSRVTDELRAEIVAARRDRAVRAELRAVGMILLRLAAIADPRSRAFAASVLNIDMHGSDPDDLETLTALVDAGDFGEKYHGAIDAVEFCGSMGAQSFREVATLPMPGEAEPEPEPDASDPDTTTDAPAVVLPLRPRRKFWE
jgi:hypothetical protein